MQNFDKNEKKPISWDLTVTEDPDNGDLLLQFPTDLLEAVGWKSGDTLEWADNGDGSYALYKK
jgi:hypothetical protein